MSASLQYISSATRRRNNFLVFCLYWVLVFAIYLPTAQAGRVGDFPGWVLTVTSRSFLDYINRKGFVTPSLYQFTQILTYGFYQLFGPRPWPWHVLFVSMQALNALLLYTFFKNLFLNSGIRNAALVAFSGSLLFCVCPHISEVVVWEPAFHYLLGLLFIIAVLHCAQQYLLTLNVRYAWWGALLFFLSTYSLEVFYLTPLFVTGLIVFYAFMSKAGGTILKRALLYFTLPQAVLFLLHLIVLRAVYHQNFAHIGATTTLFSVFNCSKALKYVFHILLFGRFYSQAFREHVYHFCESAKGLLAFYGVLFILVTFIVVRIRHFRLAGRTMVLLLFWVLLSLGLILPLWFPDSGLDIYDRYTYVLCAFVYMLLVLCLNACLNKWLFIGIVAAYALINYRFTHKVNAYWQQSAQVISNLVNTFPNDPSKKILLVNLPECLDGVQMVGTRDDGEFRMLYNSVMPRQLTNTIYDVEAFYMRSPADGAHVNVVNDSIIKVTLNQWGTWWIYYGYGAYSYENADYKVVMRDLGHWYDLILKHPASEYLVLFIEDGKWKKVDLTKKNEDQY